MGISAGPNIVRDSSLVLDLDASDRNSYISGSLTWYDVSGNNNTGSLFGPPGYDSSNGGNFIFYNSVTNPGINIGNPSTLTFSQNAFSLVVWFKYAASGFFLNKSIVNVGGFNFWYTGTYLRFQIYSGSIAPAPINVLANINSSSYYQASATYDGSVANTYINGTLVGTQTNSQTIVNTAGDFEIGYRYDNANANYNSSGSIYAVQVYNRAISATEVQQNYNAKKSRFGLT
jgi:Concanavalin A-like lectin/glucanases superfamily